MHVCVLKRPLHSLYFFITSKAPSYQQTSLVSLRCVWVGWATAAEEVCVERPPRNTHSSYFCTLQLLFLFFFPPSE